MVYIKPSSFNSIVQASAKKYKQIRNGWRYVCLLSPLTHSSLIGSTGRFSVLGNRVQSIDPTHRINDRDYMGWMDFGRRSAEEYEYSS